MGRSSCRNCGVPNGSGEFTDGTLVWPEGLAHYVTEHDRTSSPDPSSDTSSNRSESLEADDVSTAWWAAGSEEPIP